MFPLSYRPKLQSSEVQGPDGVEKDAVDLLAFQPQT